MAGSSVILYSGGMDSYCLSKLYPEPDLLFIETGTKDNLIEQQIIPSWVPRVQFNMAAWELENKIIPFRNCFFILMAAQQYSEIFIGATAGDTTKDKDFVFKSMMESLMNYFGLDREKNGHDGYPYQVHMPFKTLTKTEILAEYLDAGFSIEPLLNESRSCYDGTEKQECGVCRSCLRKFIAFAGNGLAHRTQFLHTPSIADLSAFLLESRAKGRGREVQEIEAALKSLQGVK